MKDLAFPAVVLAGEGRSAKTVYGRNKVYLELDGRPLVAHLVSALRRVPEVSEIWVVGDPKRLKAALAEEYLPGKPGTPVHIVPQRWSLFENAWGAFRMLLPGAGPEGRDPKPEDYDTRALYLSGDLPFATPEEITQFIRRAGRARCDYAIGMVGAEAMRPFHPKSPGGPGIRMMCSNFKEGRFRHSNLHLVKLARIARWRRIEETFEHRYQKRLTNIVRLALHVLLAEESGIATLLVFLHLHLASFADRKGWRRTADLIRRSLPIARVESHVGRLLGASFRLIPTDMGGCAVDIDNEGDYDAARARYSEWRTDQQRLARQRSSPSVSARRPGP
ncbi:MAG: nucleotidyltransferase family protein [Elusimicrobiota bacterium]